MTTEELNITEVSWGDHRVRFIKLGSSIFVPITDIAKVLKIRKRSLHSRLSRSPDLFLLHEKDLYLKSPGGRQNTICLDKYGIISLLSELRSYKRGSESLISFLKWIRNSIPESSESSVVGEEDALIRYERYIMNKLHAKEYNYKRRDKSREYSKEYKKTHSEALKVKARRYHQSPNGKLSLKNQKYFRKAKTREFKITLVQWNKTITNQSSCCNYCHRKFTSKRPATMDHIIPLAKGGTHTFENIQALCRECNLSKHTKIDKGHINVWINFKEQPEATT